MGKVNTSSAKYKSLRQMKVKILHTVVGVACTQGVYQYMNKI